MFFLGREYELSMKILLYGDTPKEPTSHSITWSLNASQ